VLKAGVGRRGGDPGPHWLRDTHRLRWLSFARLAKFVL